MAEFIFLRNPFLDQLRLESNQPRERYSTRSSDKNKTNEFGRKKLAIKGLETQTENN